LLTEHDGFWYCTAIALSEGEERRYRIDRVNSAVEVTPPPGAAEAIRLAKAPRPDYDDPAHAEVIVELTYRGARLAEDLAHVGDAVRQIAPDRWELRFRCPPSELDYWARTLYGFGAQAQVMLPAELRVRIRDMLAATVAIYADADPDSRESHW
jgi:predicted DNA-binding transcriptional regulator YafY